jgi:hypothetical protein
LAAFAENAAQDFGNGEDELAVGDFVADGGGDPVASGAGAALVVGRTEVAAASRVLGATRRSHIAGGAVGGNWARPPVTP